MAQFFADLGAARCARDQRCAAEQGRQYGSLEACAEADDVISAISVALNGRPLGDLLATAYALADANTRQACLDSVNNTPCSDPVPVGPCELALPPLLAAQEGEACGARTCVAGLYCRSVNNTCAVCTARGNPGDACLTSEHCASNECIATDGGRVCVAAGSQPGPGQRCMSSCRGNLVCVAQGDGGSACTGRAGAGETCSPRNELRPSCVSDLGCLTVDGGAVGTCVGGLTTGSACTRGETQECVCTYATPTAPTGVCNQPPGALDDGEPCGNWLFASFHVCSQDAYPVVFNDGGVTGCVCRARFADCSACTYDDQCATDFCAGPANAMQCRTPAANGLPCNGNVDCASGYCDSVTDTCAPLPACP